MRHVPIKVLLAACIVAALALPAIAREAAPPGSFVKYRAASVQELSAQLASEPAVLARYSRHFNTSGERISAFFANELQLVTLKSPLKVQMWYVGRDGKIHSKSKLLPKGTMVFSTRDNKPVLSWSCGNPMRADLPVVQVKSQTPETSPIASATQGEAAASATETVAIGTAQPAPVVVETPATAVAANPLEATAAAAITAAPAPAAAAAVPIAAPVVVDAAAIPAVAAVPPVIAAAGGAGFGWLGALAGIGGVAALAGGGGGSSAPAPVIPEPSTVLALVTGLVGTAACGLRQLRVRR